MRIFSVFLLSLLFVSCAVAAPQDDTRSEAVSVVPAPAEMEFSGGAFELSPKTTLYVDPAFAEYSLEKLVRAYFGTATGFPLASAPADSAGIVFRKTAPDAKLGSEGYRLSVKPGGVVVEAPTAAGAFYAAQTLRQLFPPAVFAGSKVEGVAWRAPGVEIVDYPRFEWRGMHMDVSRHFFGPEYVKRFIDLLALHKFNTFHWHLCDDDGWRVEIRKYPELTAKGSSGHRDGSYGKAMFYTQSQVREIVRYAAERHVNIVPEIEIPGHEMAAVQVHPEWGARNAKGELGNVFNIRDATVAALKDILGEVVELFPCRYVHCGGDEVWAAWVWQADPESKAKAERLGLKGARGIQTWMMNEMAAFLKSKGRRMVGWGEISGEKLDADTVVMAWRGTGKTGVAAAKKGYDVVMAPGAYTYFDHRQAPNEKGFGGAVLTLERVYSFDPVNPKLFSAEAAGHVLGCQGQLWSEVIATDARMDYMAYPRATALAEVAWTPQKQRSFPGFLKRLPTHLRRLDLLGVKYRFPMDLSFEEKDGALHIKPLLRLGPIRYTTDGSEPNAGSPVWSKPIPLDKIRTVRARMVAPDGALGPVAKYVGSTASPLLPETCAMNGGFKIESLLPGRKNIGIWRSPKWSLVWRVRFEKPGRYKVRGEFAGTAPAKMRLKVGDKTLDFTVPPTQGWGNPAEVEIGSVDIPSPGVYRTILSVAGKKGFRGINVWKIDFAAE